MADKIMLPTEPSEALAYLEHLARAYPKAEGSGHLVIAIAQIKLLLKISEQLDGLGTALADLQVELEIQRD